MKSPWLLRFKNYWEGNFPNTYYTLFICALGIRRYFDVPKSATYIRLVFTKKPTESSIKFRLGDPKGRYYNYAYFDKSIDADLTSLSLSEILAKAAREGKFYVYVEYKED
jgi:hypothetical protein